MRTPDFSGFRSVVTKETDEIRSSIKDVVADARETWRDARTFGDRLNTPPVISSGKLRRFVITAIKVLIGLELFGALVQGASGGDWSRLGWDLVIAGVLYVAWDKITRITIDKKADYRRRIEAPGGGTKLWDALVFSLLWTDEIYAGIPSDRRQLVVMSYTLIALGLAAAFLRVGEGFMATIIAGALVLAAVNLLAWVVSRERTAKEDLQTELRLAREVQVSLMPKSCPVVDGFEIAGESYPAQEVGGDHFDYLSPPAAGGRLAISIFDVSGKGMQAAMSAVFTSGALVTEAKNSPTPAEILSGLNSSVYRYSQRGHFVAFLLAMLDPATRTLTFANAGQTKPLLVRNGGVEWLDARGVTFALGMKDAVTYEDQSLPLERGDVVLLLTDGFTESMNASRDLYGAERLADLVRAIPPGSRSAGEIITVLAADVRRHAGAVPQHDDMTVVVIRVL